jgi:hypothetical protein
MVPRWGPIATRFEVGWTVGCARKLPESIAFRSTSFTRQPLPVPLAKIGEIEGAAIFIQ